MLPEKERSPFDRALVAGWSTILALIEPTSNKLDRVLYYVQDPRIPRIDSYPGFSEKGMASFDLEGEYFDVDSKSMRPCTLSQVMNEPGHQAHYLKRSVVFKGETRDGKTELAKVLARRMAAVHQREVDVGMRKFLVIRGIEQLKSDAVREHLETMVPLVFDDLMPGQCMHTSAEPTSFLKNMFEPTPGELYCRYTCANLAAGPRLFTTNEKDLDKWLSLRSDCGGLTDAHKHAVLARTVFFETKGKLYTPDQSSGSNEVNVAEHLFAASELVKFKKFGF
jgi:hypothetical protein